MESEYRKGYVYIQNHLAGIIAETEEGYVLLYGGIFETERCSRREPYTSIAQGTL